MFITITNASKGKPHRQIGIKSISGRVGWYNIKEELEWRYTYRPSNLQVILHPSELSVTIEPGLYNFDSLKRLPAKLMDLRLMSSRTPERSR